MKPSPLDHLPRRSLFAEATTPKPVSRSVSTPTVSKVEIAVDDDRKATRREYQRDLMRKRRAAKADGPKLVRLTADAEADAEIERQRAGERGRK